MTLNGYEGRPGFQGDVLTQIPTQVNVNRIRRGLLKFLREKVESSDDGDLLVGVGAAVETMRVLLSDIENAQWRRARRKARAHARKTNPQGEQNAS